MRVHGTMDRMALVVLLGLLRSAVYPDNKTRVCSSDTEEVLNFDISKQRVCSRRRAIFLSADSQTK